VPDFRLSNIVYRASVRLSDIDAGIIVLTDDGPIDFTTDAPVTGSLDVAWSHGARSKKRDTGPLIQVHAYDEHTYILRQSKSVSYEAPFMFLLFGNERAILFDTGATTDPATFPIRRSVDRLMTEWLALHPRSDYGLVVAHTHGHGDHVAGDAQFADRAATTIVGRDVESVRSFFGFTDWPAETVSYDLGGRILEVIGSPGHHKAAITVYDPWTGWLLTGDTVLPGRLYAFDMANFTATLQRLVEFTDNRPVTHMLGCHIEMTTAAGRDYPLGATYQPHEHALSMSAADLRSVRDAATAVADRRGAHRFDDFILYNNPSQGRMLRMMLRGLVYRFVSPWRRAR
jgi:glyoxylase-like metal-dependent hydrolase (beta-lactamase superfamily II)